jgi:arylsulfatase A-like enzyme
MRKPNIVIIVLDTLREDHAQGLDKLLDYGFVKYQNAITPAPWTLPSHASMFTGLYPSEHGIHETKELRGEELIRHARARMNALKDHNVFDKLKDEGYTTYLISANEAWVTPLTGFKADVNLLVDFLTKMIITDDTMKINEKVKKYRGHLNFLLNTIKNKNLTDAVMASKLSLLRRLRKLPAYISEYFVRDKGGELIHSLISTMNFDEPFFLFVNLMESHDPYTNLREFTKMRCTTLRWVLTGEIRPEDKKFWRNYALHAERAVNAALKVVATILKRYDASNMLIIVTADHGELLGDDGLHHVHSLKDGNIKVPLYVKYPEDWKKKKQRTYISLTEIPKILDPEVEYLGSNIALAETFGPFQTDEAFKRCNLKMPLDITFQHKIRILHEKFDILFNKTLNKIESMQGDKEIATKLLKIYS